MDQQALVKAIVLIENGAMHQHKRLPICSLCHRQWLVSHGEGAVAFRPLISSHARERLQPRGFSRITRNHLPPHPFSGKSNRTGELVPSFLTRLRASIDKGPMAK